MLYRQVLEGSIGYAERQSLELDADEIPTVSQVKIDGRRKQNGNNLWQQILGKDAKAGRFTCTQLTVAQVQQMATTTKPTNDATITHDGTDIVWSDNSEELYMGIFLGLTLS